MVWNAWKDNVKCRHCIKKYFLIDCIVCVYSCGPKKMANKVFSNLMSGEKDTELRRETTCLV